VLSGAAGCALGRQIGEGRHDALFGHHSFRHVAFEAVHVRRDAPWVQRLNLDLPAEHLALADVRPH